MTILGRIWAKAMTSGSNLLTVHRDKLQPLRGGRSLNPTSTASQSMFVLPLSSHHHHTSIRPQLRTSTCLGPLPSLEGCGPDHQRHQQVQKLGSQPHLPLPSSEGCGRLLVIDGGIGDGEKQGGAPEVGGPNSASRKWGTTFVGARYLPSLLPQSATNAHCTQAPTTHISNTSKAMPWPTLVVRIVRRRHPA